MNQKIVLLVWLAVLGAGVTACSGKTDAAASSQAAAGQAAPAAASGAPADQAGSGGGPAQGAARARRFGELLKSLNLTPEQTAKVRQIIADARKKNEGADRDTRRANMRAAYAQIQSDVLTPDQRAIFEKKMAEMRAKSSPSPAPQ